MKSILSASILSADFAVLGEQIHAVQAAGADWIHVDVMDGHFVPNISMGPFVVNTCRRITRMPLDVHLMIEEPDRYLEDFAEAGASSITVHVEAGRHVYRTLQAIRHLGCRVGVTLNPGTPAASLSPILHLVDMVLVLTVNPGFSGQEFIPDELSKIREIDRMLKAAQSPALIQVDGGINADTISSTYEAGARVFVAASAIFEHPDGIAAGVRSLRENIPA